MDKKDDTTGPNNNSQQIPPEKAAEAMKAFGEMMESLGAKKREDTASEKGSAAGNVKVEPGQAGPLPEMMLNLFATAIQTAQAKQQGQPGQATEARSETGASDENVVDLKTEREKRAPRKPTELEKELQGNLKDTFQTYVDEKVAPGAKPGTEIQVDGAFLQEHGPALMGALIKSMATTILPEDKQISIPVKKEGDEEAVKLKLDLNGLFNKIMAPPKKD